MKYYKLFDKLAFLKVCEINFTKQQYLVFNCLYNHLNNLVDFNELTSLVVGSYVIEDDDFKVLYGVITRLRGKTKGIVDIKSQKGKGYIMTLCDGIEIKETGATNENYYKCRAKEQEE